MFYYLISMHLNAIVHDQISELPLIIPPVIILPRWSLNMMSVFLQRIRIDTLLDEERLLRFVV
jgi:hypothetical protein